jgi:hypothetical protein
MLQTSIKGCTTITDKAESDLTATVEKAKNFTPRPGTTVPTQSKLISKLRAEGISFQVSFDAHSGYPLVKDSLTEEAQKWQVPPQNPSEEAQHKAFVSKFSKESWAVILVRDRLNGFGSSVVQAKVASLQCAGAVKGAANILYQAQQSGDADSIAKARAATTDLLREAGKAAAITAVSASVFASYQAAMAGDHPEVLDTTLTGLQQSLPLQPTIGDDDIDKEVTIIASQYQEGNARADAARQAAVAQASGGPGSLGGPMAGPGRRGSGVTATMPRESTTDSGSGGATGAGSGGALGGGLGLATPGGRGMGDVNKGMNLAGAVASGDVGGAADAAMSFLPPDSPYRQAYDAAKGVASGDYKAALKSGTAAASQLLRGTSIGTACGVASNILKLF